MLKFLNALLACLLLAAVPGVAAVAGEVNVAGLWRGTLYGSDLQAQVFQEGHAVKAEVVVHAISGETNVYHVVGAIFNGHLYVLHGSGHVFEGEARGNEVTGVLTTKGGSKIELRATRVEPEPAGQGSSGGDAAGKQPG